MLKYYGDRSCAPCRETKAILDQYGINFQFIDVQGDPFYKDRTPILELDEGTMLNGKDAILEWLGMVLGE